MQKPRGIRLIVLQGAQEVRLAAGEADEMRRGATMGLLPLTASQIKVTEEICFHKVALAVVL